MVPDETSDLPTTLPEASFLNPNRKVPSEARSLRGLFPVPVFAEFPSYSLSKNADGFLQNPFWLSYCNLRKLKCFSDGFRFNEIKTPAVHAAANNRKAARMVFISSSAPASSSAVSPMYKRTVTVTTTILKVCPTDRIVAKMEDATP